MANFDKAVPPGQEGKITLKLNTSRRNGKTTKSAAVYSNDPKKPTARISLTCFVKQYVSIKPSDRINMVGFEGDKLSQQVTIEATEEGSLEITDVSSNVDEKIEYELKAVEKGKKYTLEVKNKSTEEGFIRGNINLKTSSSKKPLISLPLYVKLQKELDVKPNSLAFGKINISGDDDVQKRLTKRVMVKKNRGEDLAIKKIKPSADWIMTETETNQEGKQYRIIITLDKGKMSKGPFDEKIEIKTNSQKEPLVVTLKGEAI